MSTAVNNVPDNEINSEMLILVKAMRDMEYVYGTSKDYDLEVNEFSSRVSVRRKAGEKPKKHVERLWK